MSLQYLLCAHGVIDSAHGVIDIVQGKMHDTDYCNCIWCNLSMGIFSRKKNAMRTLSIYCSYLNLHSCFVQESIVKDFFPEFV